MLVTRSARMAKHEDRIDQRRHDCLGCADCKGCCDIYLDLFFGQAQNETTGTADE